jgi:hypothetical protein
MKSRRKRARNGATNTYPLLAYVARFVVIVTLFPAWGAEGRLPPEREAPR